MSEIQREGIPGGWGEGDGGGGRMAGHNPGQDGDEGLSQKTLNVRV